MLTANDQLNVDEFFDKINRERISNERKPIERDSILQYAAEKRCRNHQQIFQTYQQIQTNHYHPEQWAKDEKLDRYFPYVSEVISFTPFDLFVPSHFYRSMFISVGFTTDQYENFSVRCILYGTKMTSISSSQQLFRLLYILIGCALFLLTCVIFSLISDRYQTKSNRDQEENLPLKQTNRKTMGRLSSFVKRDERSSAVHGFIQ